jgi:hypothetical protein
LAVANHIARGLGGDFQKRVWNSITAHGVTMIQRRADELGLKVKIGFTRFERRAF